MFLAALLVLLASGEAVAFVSTDRFFAQQFKDKDGCFLMVDMDDGAIIHQHNAPRCAQRFVPCSTFKLVMSVMAFERGFFKSTDQRIKWDRKKHARSAENRDQTPKTFIAHSVNWVGDRILASMTRDQVRTFIDRFEYGNKAVSKRLTSHDLDHGDLQISAAEQVNFLRRLWRGKLTSAAILAKVRRVSQIEASKDRRVFGKTGTGCVDKWCMHRPGRQLGWFIGVLERGARRYVFAANHTTLKSVRGYAGPRMREIVLKYLSDFYPTP